MNKRYEDPEAAEAACKTGRAALHFRERTEGDDFEQRYARAASTSFPART